MLFYIIAVYLLTVALGLFYVKFYLQETKGTINLYDFLIWIFFVVTPILKFIYIGFAFHYHTLTPFISYLKNKDITSCVERIFKIQ